MITNWQVVKYKAGERIVVRTFTRRADAMCKANQLSGSPFARGPCVHFVRPVTRPGRMRRRNHWPYSEILS